MTPLATKIYKALRKHTMAGHASTTYGELAGVVGVHPRSPHLHAALGEVTNACRHHQLPALPAIVWRSGTRRPSTGYYKAAHPRAHTDATRISAWEREHPRVLSSVAAFPPTLG